MEIVPLSRNVLTFCGVWRPISCSQRSLKILYNIYSIITISMLYTLMLFQCLHLMINRLDLHDLIDDSFLLMSILNVCCKMVTIAICQNRIKNLMKLLINAPHKACNEEENNIQSKYNGINSAWTNFYGKLSIFTIIFIVLKSIYTFGDRTLLFPIWCPYDYSNSLVIFSISWIIQILSLVIGASVNFGTDTMITGLMVGVSAQLDFLRARLQNLPILRKNLELNSSQRAEIYENIEKETTKECVRYHKQIYEFAQQLNIVFNPVIFCQFSISMMIFCLTVFHLSTSKVFSVEFCASLMYLCAVLNETFLYCWHGNEVTLKSISTIDDVYAIDWMELRVQEQRDLLFMMMRCRTPIKFTSSFLVTLSTQSFVIILKTSYSVFNLMKNS